MTDEEFINATTEGKMLEVTNFNNWLYGTSIDSLKADAINIGVFNPEGIMCLLEESDRIDLDLYYVMASDKTRLIRQLTREDNPNIEEILRRFKTDEKDFLDLPAGYVRIENETEYDFIDCLVAIESISLGK
jgi:guanylate kinase